MLGRDARATWQEILFLFISMRKKLPFPGGAKAMIEDGCLDGVDVIFGTRSLGTDSVRRSTLVREGAIMAAADRFEIVIQGKGGPWCRAASCRLMRLCWARTL